MGEHVMTVGQHVTLRFERHPNGGPITRAAAVKKTEGQRAQFRCVDSLPYPAVWDFRRLLPGQEVYVKTSRSWWVGRWSGGGGRNVSLIELTRCEDPRFSS